MVGFVCLCPCVILYNLVETCLNFLCNALISIVNVCVCVCIVCVTTCHHYPQPPTDQGVRSYFNFSFCRRNKNSRTWTQFPSQSSPVHSSGPAQLAHSKPNFSFPASPPYFFFHAVPCCN